MKSQKKYYFWVVYYDSITDYIIVDVLLRMYINLFIKSTGVCFKINNWEQMVNAFCWFFCPCIAPALCPLSIADQ